MYGWALSAKAGRLLCTGYTDDYTNAEDAVILWDRGSKGEPVSLWGGKKRRWIGTGTPAILRLIVQIRKEIFKKN
jgi:hypothetical protein